MTSRIGFRTRLVVALVVAVAVTALLVGAISVPLARSSLQDALRDDAIIDTRATLTGLIDDSGLPANPTDDQIADSGLVARLEARGADGVWLEVAEQAPFVSSLAMLEGPNAISEDVRATIEGGEIGWEFTTIAGAPVLVTGGQRPDDRTTVFLVTSTTAVAEVTSRLRQTILLVALVVGIMGSMLAWMLANRLLRPVALAGQAATAMAAGDLDMTLPTGPDQFGQLGVAFNTMASSLKATFTRLEQARDRELQFVADASHDLRTPVTGLVAAADMLEVRLATADVDDDTQRLAAAVDREAVNLQRLVTGLLEVSRANDDDAREVASGIGLADRLQTLIATRLPDAVLVAPATTVAVPAMAFERIMGNLLDNARIHADGHQTQVIAQVTRSTGDAASQEPDDSSVAAILEVEVADRGPGIAADQLEQVFARLTTGTAARGSGTGLGLAIARQQARLHDGDLTAHRRPGGGTSMRLVMPVAQLLHDGDPTATTGSHDDVSG